LADSDQDLARPGSSSLGSAELLAFHASVIESNEGKTLLVALKGFIGAPGVITVFGLMVVKVVLLVLDPDDEHAATTVIVVATASGSVMTLNLRMFMRHLL
jgi:hypothetical protein